MIADKIISIKDFAAVQEWNESIVFTNGCFDIIHAGHAQYLEEAKELGEILVVGLNSDASVKRLKGTTRPINNEMDRAFVLAALEAVDYVIIFNEDTPLELIKAIQPDVLVKGGDWAEKDIVGADIVKAKGGRVLSLPFREGLSTTNIIKALGKEL
jgi:D-beta-D-heptose 7-phosphate kinase/D-beta-D-heptose 1-phosphate adenosyltransferase